MGSVVDDRYEIGRRLGQGGMGAVYEVRHVRLKKRFAMKVIHQELALLSELAARFEREALAMSRLKHPNCVSVTDFGTLQSGEPYLVMEYVDGLPLTQMLDSPQPPLEALEVVRQILLGLEHAHTQGIIHRDIKPSNVMLERSPAGKVTAKLVDFGIAKLRTTGDESPLTQTGLIMGTPEYMAPEQAVGRDLDARADLYAVGVILWRLLTGEPLFDVDDGLKLLPLKVSRPPPTLDRTVPGTFSRPWNEVLQTALRRDPDLRYQTARSFLTALEPLKTAPLAPVSEPTLAQPVTVAARLPSQFKRRLQSAGSALRTLPGVWRRWYDCSAQAELPGWRARLRGLWGTVEGRVVLGSAAGGLLALALVVALSSSTSPDKLPAPLPSTAQASAVRTPGQAVPSENPDLPPELRDRLRKARSLLLKGACREASADLQSLINSRPKLVRAHYYLGAAMICRRRYEDGLAAYNKTIELDPRYRSDPRILEDAQKLLRSRKLRARTLSFLAQQIGEPALKVLLGVTTHRNLKLRQQAVAAVERLGGSESIDWPRVLELDLDQLPSCDDRRRVVERLRELGTKKAITILRRARDRRRRVLGLFKGSYKHACIRQEIVEAIKALLEEVGEDPEGS
jgi:tRNA A-37 threonylcarbamoyl transferase component Bud32/tetratricopeptide (TPR) repeat protein